MHKQLFISLCIFLFIIVGTILAIIYGNGYQFGFVNGQPQISGTGILAVKSIPDGALVSINGHLTTATNNTINLKPDTYDVKITKDSYFSWEKKITIQKEIVSQVNALLIPTAPSPTNITDTGVINPTIDPSMTKIAYTASASADKRLNGIFILDTKGGSLLTLQSNSRQIVDDNPDTFSQASLSWTPDGKSIIASISANKLSPTVYLLDATTMNQTPKDITTLLDSYQAGWAKEKADTAKALIDSLTPPLAKVASTHFTILGWSPDEYKILYQASGSATTIPRIINPPIIGADSTPEARNLESGNVYVYDLKEDRNYLVVKNDLKLGLDYKLTWLPDSQHLIYVHDKRIAVIEYDGSNSTTVYAGPFVDHSVFPWADMSKLVMLSDLGNSNIDPHLYTIGLK